MMSGRSGTRSHPANGAHLVLIALLASAASAEEPSPSDVSLLSTSSAEKYSLADEPLPPAPLTEESAPADEPSLTPLVYESASTDEPSLRPLVVESASTDEPSLTPLVDEFVPSDEPSSAEAVVVTQSDEPVKADGNMPNVEDDLTPEKSGSDKGRFFLWAQYSTMTKYQLSLTTTTVPHTCLKATNKKACSGRRRRAYSDFRAINVKNLDSSPIMGSMQEADHNPGVDDESEPRNLFTVWSTATSLRTVTVYTTNTSVTVSVSAACTISGQSFPLCSG